MSSQANDDFEQTRSLVLALGKARNLLATQLDAELKEGGINGQQLSILLALAREDARSPFELAKLLGVHPGRATRVLDKLEDIGLVQRIRSDKDRRVVHVSLTQAGRETVARREQVAPEAWNRRHAHFSRSDFDTLSILIGKLINGWT